MAIGTFFLVTFDLICDIAVSLWCLTWIMVNYYGWVNSKCDFWDKSVSGSIQLNIFFSLELKYYLDLLVDSKCRFIRQNMISYHELTVMERRWYCYIARKIFIDSSFVHNRSYSRVFSASECTVRDLTTQIFWEKETSGRGTRHRRSNLEVNIISYLHKINLHILSRLFGSLYFNNLKIIVREKQITQIL